MARTYTVTATTTLTANSTKSLILLNPVTVASRIVEIGISLDNVTTNAEPVKFDLYRVTTLGSPAGSPAVPMAGDEALEAAQTTAINLLSTEPSTVQIYKYWVIQPNSGLFVLQSPLGREFTVKGGGNRVGLRYTTVAGVAPVCYSYIEFEE